MKNFTLFLLLFLIGASNSSAQSTVRKDAEKKRPAATFVAGDLELKAGVGVLPTFVGDGGRTLTPPVQATLSYRFSPAFSMGAYAGYTSIIGDIEEFRDGSAYQSQNDFRVFGLRMAGHLTRLKNIDLYGGMMFAYNSPQVTTTQISASLLHTPNDDLTTPRPSPYRPGGARGSVMVSGFVGGAYYFAPRASVFGEVGYGISIATLGLGYKF